MNYNDDTKFERCPPGYVLQEGDRMRRVNSEAASSLKWFKIADYDVGQKASYFDSGGFCVERRTEEARKKTPMTEDEASEIIRESVNAARQGKPYNKAKFKKALQLIFPKKKIQSP